MTQWDSLSPASKVYQYVVCHLAKKVFNVIYAQINVLYLIQNNKLTNQNAFLVYLEILNRDIVSIYLACIYFPRGVRQSVLN